MVSIAGRTGFEVLGASSAGLISDEAKERLEKYGYNELEVKKQGPLIRFLIQFRNALPYVLMAAALICAPSG